MAVLIKDSTMQTIRNRAKQLHREYEVVREYAGWVTIRNLSDGRLHDVDTERRWCDCPGFAARQTCAHVQGVGGLVERKRCDEENAAKRARLNAWWETTQEAEDSRIAAACFAAMAGAARERKAAA